MAVLFLITCMQLDVMLAKGRLVLAAVVAVNLAVGALWFGMNFGLIPTPDFLNRCIALCK